MPSIMEDNDKLKPSMIVPNIAGYQEGGEVVEYGSNTERVMKLER
jgi:hypothetical protein